MRRQPEETGMDGRRRIGARRRRPESGKETSARAAPGFPTCDSGRGWRGGRRGPMGGLGFDGDGLWRRRKASAGCGLQRVCEGKKQGKGRGDSASVGRQRRRGPRRPGLIPRVGGKAGAGTALRRAAYLPAWRKKTKGDFSNRPLGF